MLNPLCLGLIGFFDCLQSSIEGEGVGEESRGARTLTDAFITNRSVSENAEKNTSVIIKAEEHYMCPLHSGQYGVQAHYRIICHVNL